jgi:molybdopterin converting factor subunit 1
MKVTIRLFARARDQVGQETVALEVPDDATVADVRRQLVEAYPALESLSPHLLVSVGTDYVTDEATVTSGEEIAVFPPVSGG